MDSYAIHYFIFLQEGRTISELFINEQIRDKEVRVIGENGEQLGVMSIREAMQLAEDAGVDLVKIAPTAKPPVCKIVDYGKFKYEQTRKEKEAKKKQKVIEIKKIFVKGRQGKDHSAFPWTRDGAYGKQQAYSGRFCQGACGYQRDGEGPQGRGQKHDNVFN